MRLVDKKPRFRYNTTIKKRGGRHEAVQAKNVKFIGSVTLRAYERLPFLGMSLGNI